MKRLTLFLALSLALLFLFACKSKDEIVEPVAPLPQETQAAAQPEETAEAAAETPAAEETPAMEETPKTAEAPEEAKELEAVIQTSEGDITIKLYKDEAPLTVKNFVGLAKGDKGFQDPKSGRWVKYPFYDGLTFHKVKPGLLIQTGDPTGTGRGGPGYVFKDEIVPTLTFNRKGIVAMANTGPNSNGSQFFITLKAEPWLNGKNTIFGEVVSGFGTVETISNADRNALDRPIRPITIKTIKIIKK